MRRWVDGWSAQAVLFDVDGVLIDTADAHGRVWRAWARARGLDPEAVWVATQGRRRADILRMVAPERDQAEEHRALDRLMAAEEPGFRAFHGAAGLLRVLPPGRWAVVTSSRAEPTAARLARTGLVVPEVRVCAEDVSEGKPSPEGYLTAAARLGTDPARCLVVEDAPAGIAAGLAAGCTVYAVASTHRPEELRAAHACFGSLREAAGAVLRAVGRGGTRGGDGTGGEFGGGATVDGGTLAHGGTVAGGADVVEEEAGAQEAVGPIRRTHVTEE